MAQQSAYQRPYKTRQQRRESARQRYDESKDHKFLVRAAIAIGLVLVMALGFAAKGLADHGSTPPPSALR